MALSTTNFHGKLLQDLMARLKTVTELKFIAEDLAQIDEYEMRASVKFPCALIDLPDSTYEHTSETTQTGVVSVQVRLAFNPYANAHADAPEFKLNASLERFEIEQKVINALHGWAGSTEYQALSRRRVSSTPRADGMRVRVLMFDTYYEDDSQQEVYTPQAVTVKINASKL